MIFETPLTPPPPPLLSVLVHRPGSYLVRPSERNIGDYALAFRTGAEMRHWRIVQDNGKFYVHPRPNPYDSLEDIVQVLQ